MSNNKKYIITVPYTETLDIVVDSPDLPMTDEALMDLAFEQHGKHISDNWRVNEIDYTKGEYITSRDGIPQEFDPDDVMDEDFDDD